MEEGRGGGEAAFVARGRSEVCTHRFLRIVSMPISFGIDPSSLLRYTLLWSTTTSEKEVKRACGEKEREREREWEGKEGGEKPKIS